MATATSFKTRLLFLVFSMATILLVVGAIGIYGMNNINENLKSMYDDRVLPLDQLKTVSDMYAVNIVDTSHKVRNGNLKWADGRKNVDEAVKTRDAKWKEYVETYLTPEEKKLVGEAVALMKGSESSVKKLSGIFDRENRAELDAFVLNELYQVVDPVTAKIDELVQLQIREAKVLNADSTKTFSIIFIAAVVISLISLIFAIVYGLRVVRTTMNQVGGEPAEIQAIAERIAQGDISMKADSASAKGIYGAIMKMSDELRRIIAEIKVSAGSMASGSEQLSASSEEITRTMSDQSGRSSQIATAAEEMSRTVIDIAKNSASIADSSKDTARIAGMGAEIVNKSSNESKEIVETVGDSVKVMQTLGERSKQIGDIVAVINDIADQTNLLALNAAIEAARAGEQGRGFAVVADEVRKLAERTAKATAEIGGMISSIQSEVGNAVSAMDTTSKKVETGLQYSLEAGNQLNEIVNSITSLQAMVQQIATATEEMSSTSDAISNDIQAVSAGSKEISAESEQIAQSSSELARLAGTMKNIVSHFKV
jgi:methyl-accepting chemotaxis protein